MKELLKDISQDFYLAQGHTFAAFAHFFLYENKEAQEYAKKAKAVFDKANEKLEKIIIKIK